MALDAVNASYTGNATEHALDAVARDRADQSMENLVRTLFRTFFPWKLSDLNEGEWREKKVTGKRTWDEMSSTEKQLVEDYERNSSPWMLLVKKPRT